MSEEPGCSEEDLLTGTAQPCGLGRSFYRDFLPEAELERFPHVPAALENGVAHVESAPLASCALVEEIDVVAV